MAYSVKLLNFELCHNSKYEKALIDLNVILPTIPKTSNENQFIVEDSIFYKM